ncbi:MAG: DNA-deoxyinosine glycosylase [Tagaea sp. CACIAM 22H2]|nr:DNA-deoxyinosine glycosylase [Tagaea sp. CACIAM 22H2]
MKKIRTPARKAGVRVSAPRQIDAGFPPILGAAPRFLILGSLPSQASLAAAQYYAHPRNAFWPVMGAILGFDATLPYEARVEKLKDSRIAVWDVCAAAHRPGSLDSDIAPETVTPNDFAALFARHPSIGAVLLNGGTAADLFKSRVLPTLKCCPDRHRLPSTSPAHAGMSFDDKRAHWAAALGR